jgi:hypothetical protein
MDMESGAMDRQKAIETLIDRLRGTCNNMTSEAEALGLDDMDSDVCAAIDAEIFECTVCGWWFEIAEEASEDFDLYEWTCRGCAEVEG